MMIVRMKITTANVAPMTAGRLFLLDEDCG